MSSAVPLLAWVLAIGACSDDPSEVAKQQKAELDGCGFADPCPTLQRIYTLEPPDVRTCVLDALATTNPVHVSIKPAFDGPESKVEEYVGGAGLAVVWTRFLREPEHEYTYLLEQCTLVDRSFFVDCRNGLNDALDDPCAPWHSECLPITETFCP